MSVKLLPSPGLSSFEFTRGTGPQPGSLREHRRSVRSKVRGTVPLERATTFARERISKKRYAHTLRVADTAERLATLHGLDTEKVRLAALLHDTARQMKKKKFLRLAQEWRLPIGDFERKSPRLLHGPVAAELVRRELGIEDEEILEAIRAHTAGEAGMGPVALAVYIADKVEPARDYPGVEMLRKLAERDLQETTAEAIRRSKVRDEQRGRRTHPAKLRTLEWLEKAQRREQRRERIWPELPLRALPRISPLHQIRLPESA